MEKVKKLKPIVDTEGIRYGPIKVKDQDILKLFRDTIENIDTSEEV